MKTVHGLLLGFLFVNVVRAASSVEDLVRKAEAGDSIAQNDLGSRYQEGDGVPKDVAKAFVLYEKAAASGGAIPQSNLGFMYDLGLGVAQDRKTANAWYLKSAEQGYVPAMLNLGMNIAGGQGAAADLIEGMKWIDLARFLTQEEKDMHVKYAVRGAYDALKKQLTKTQLREAEKRSSAWVAAFKAKQKKD